MKVEKSDQIIDYLRDLLVSMTTFDFPRIF